MAYFIENILEIHWKIHWESIGSPAGIRPASGQLPAGIRPASGWHPEGIRPASGQISGWRLCSTVQYCTVLYSTVQYCTALYSTVQYCTVRTYRNQYKQMDLRERKSFVWDKGGVIKNVISKK